MATSEFNTATASTQSLAVPPFSLAAPKMAAPPTKFSFDFTMMAPPRVQQPPSTQAPAAESVDAVLAPTSGGAASVRLAPPVLAAGPPPAPPKARGSLRSPPPPPLLLAPPSSAFAPPAFERRLGSPPPLTKAPAGGGPASEIQLLVPSTIRTTAGLGLNTPTVHVTVPAQPAPPTTAGGVKLGANQRIISQAPSVSQQRQGADASAADNLPPTMLKTPPLICEQGPSAPSSPTSPGGSRLSLKKPSPLSVDALQRFDLLSPNYVPSMDYTKLAPVSPGYPTSDLGSSPRSSISIAPHSANWQMFRELRNKHHSNSSDYGDADSDIYGKSDFLTPGQLLSPAPFSPLSDYGASNGGTPYSSRSPNLSPFPNTSNGLHFSFDQVRSRSSMSNRNSGCGASASSGSKSPCRRRQYHNRNRHSPIHPRSLDSDDRERSRSEGEMLKKARGDDYDEDAEDEDGMDTSINHSTFSVPLRTSGSTSSSSYKKRLLQKHRKTSLRASESIPDSVTSVDSATAAGVPLPGQPGVTSLKECDVSEKERQDALLRRQPTIEEPPPSPTFAELFHSRNDDQIVTFKLDQQRQAQVEEWIRQQASALETFRNSLVPLRQEANLLQVPKNTHVPQPSVEQLSQILVQKTEQGGPPGPMRPATLWRRSRSESDVSVPINDAAYICEHCGQGFAMHDRLAKHIASRHRDRSASVNDEKNKIHKCKLCPKSFGRSDMLTRHMRLHTGLKPYTCLRCGQVFSRSDHLSTHQRTHTGEKPYRCPHCSYAASRRDMITRHMRTHLRPDGTPLGLNELQIPIAQLSLNQPPTPEPPSVLCAGGYDEIGGISGGTDTARSVSPAVFRHHPLSECASPRCASPHGRLSTGGESLSVSSLCLASPARPAVARPSEDAQDNEEIDVEASSSSEEMELDKSSVPELKHSASSRVFNPFLGYVDAGGTGADRLYKRAPTTPTPGVPPPDGIRLAQELISATLKATATTTSGTTRGPGFTGPGESVAGGTVDFSAISAILLRQQMLPTNLETAPCPSLISLVPPKATLPQREQQPQQQQYQQPLPSNNSDIQPVQVTTTASSLCTSDLSAAAADNVAAKVLSAAMAATSNLTRANTINEVNRTSPTSNSLSDANTALILSRLGTSLDMNLCAASKQFPTIGGEQQSAFRPVSFLNLSTSTTTVNPTTLTTGPTPFTTSSAPTTAPAPSISTGPPPNCGVLNGSVDVLALMTQLLNANPQLLASLQQTQQLPTTTSAASVNGRGLAPPTLVPAAPASGTTSLGGLGALFRQNSIGGLGFAEHAPPPAAGGAVLPFAPYSTHG